MKSLKTLSIAMATAAALTLAGHASADAAKGHSHEDKKIDQAAMATDMTDGEIRKVDKDSKKITIAGMSRLLISACLMVIFLLSLSTLRISPSVMSVAIAA